MDNDVNVRADISTSPIVAELLVKRYGTATNTEQYQIRKIEQEIILEGLRLQNRRRDW